jgi:hypothetical protein
MIIAELRDGGLPSFSEFTAPAFIRISVRMACGRGLAPPESLPECVKLWRMTCDEVLTFNNWDEASAWAEKAERPDKAFLLAAIDLADRRPWRAGMLSVHQAE